MRQAEADKLRAWFQGNEAAVRLFTDLADVSQLADDLVDQDQGHNLDDRRGLAVRLLHLCLVSIPANPFFMKFQGWLAPLISDAIMAWDWATSVERGGDETTLAFSFAQRDRIERAIVQAAMLIGGVEHARTVQGELFAYLRFEHPGAQTFADYCAEMNHVHR